MNPEVVPRRATTLVIGGSSAIGLAVAREFHLSGDSVIATYFKHSVAVSLPPVSWVCLDLASNESIDSLHAWLRDNGSRLDKVVFIAGLLVGKSLQDYSLDEMDAAMNINFLGQAKCVQRLLPLLNDPAQIVMMSSISGERGSYDPIYAASKGAVIAFVKSLATWLPPRVRCLAIAPGTVDGSAMHASMSAQTQRDHLHRTPLKRLMTPADLAKVVVDLTKDHWAHANGSCVRINGGAYV